MALYFTAPNDDVAVAALDLAPTGDETLRSTIDPFSNAFRVLNDLVLADALEGGDTEDEGIAIVVTRGVTRLGRTLTTAIADRDAGELTDLAAPWQSETDIDGDATDFLIDLQHIARHAQATGGTVYVLD